MSNPLISICIPTYNGAQYLQQCIDSAIEQTYKNLEIVVVDDCSTDGTWELVNKYAVSDNRIKAIRNDRNLGLVGNWNKCIDHAGGEWIKFVFQDDYVDRNCIEETVKSIEENDRLITSGRRLIFDPGLDEKVKEYSINETLTFEKLGIRATAAVNIPAARIAALAVDNICINFIGEPTVVMFSKSCVAEVGYFNADISQLCDYEYFLRIASNYGLKYIPRPFTWFRVHRQSTSSSHMKNKLFMLNHLDPIIITHQMLFDKLYQRFRYALTGRQLVKLKQFFKVRTYEARKEAKGNDAVRFDTIAGKYSQIKNNAKGGVFIKGVLMVIKLKRALTREA